jgi:hypothetical protein
VRRHFSIAIVFLALAAACSNNPSAPSGGSSVIINGSIVAPGGAASSNHFSPLESGPPVIPPGLTVAVNGTGASAIVNAAGQFSLLNVPPGNADLRFSAPGVLATVTLTGLQAGQTVEVTVTLTSSTAEVESDRRSLGREVQLEGRVQSLPPTTAPLALIVAGRTVLTDGTFFLNGAPASFAALAIGQRVHVKGQMTGDTLMARTIEIQNTNTDIGVNVNGIVANLVVTLPTFQFTVDGQLVKGDAQTTFFGNSQFSDLANGSRVEVKGAQRDGFVYAQSIHVNH